MIVDRRRRNFEQGHSLRRRPRLHRLKPPTRHPLLFRQRCRRLSCDKRQSSKRMTRQGKMRQLLPRLERSCRTVGIRTQKRARKHMRITKPRRRRRRRSFRRRHQSFRRRHPSRRESRNRSKPALRLLPMRSFAGHETKCNSRRRHPALRRLRRRRLLSLNQRLHQLHRFPSLPVPRLLNRTQIKRRLRRRRRRRLTRRHERRWTHNVKSRRRIELACSRLRRSRRHPLLHHPRHAQSPRQRRLRRCRLVRQRCQRARRHSSKLRPKRRRRRRLTRRHERR